MNRKRELENAYDKLWGIKNKLPFEEIYNDVSRFIRPIVMKQSNLIWYNGSWFASSYQALEY